MNISDLKFNEQTGNYEDASGTLHTVSEICCQIYSRELLQEMLDIRSAAYRATEAGTLLPAKRDAIERGISYARQQLIPAEQFAATLVAFRREVEAARDTWEPAQPHFAADLSA